MLFYDELLTIGQEVERIWLQPWTGATLLFALIRYISLLSRPIVLVAFFSPAWTKDSHRRSDYYSAVIMILRVWALWRKDRRILYILGFFYIVQVAFVGMALVYSKRVPLPPFLVGCILTGSSDLHTPTWLMPLFTDTAIFALTILRVVRYSREAKLGPNSILRTFVRDGVLYYFCVFSANLLNTLLYIFATEDLKAIGAGFSQTLTTVVITRLVLNLRSMHKGSMPDETQPCSAHIAAQKMSRLDFVIGSLGNTPNYDDNDGDEHDCNETTSHFTDGSKTLVNGSHSMKHRLRSDHWPAEKAKNSGTAQAPSSGNHNGNLDPYRYSFRMVQHPYRSSYTSRTISSANAVNEL
ncbi:hypothetical protein Clacol_006948 [Clathrus columnatus]|uniref:DUF6533 domain-containing protein n=1 Tax=Clathrus columnatus TaxID=1419009 RepID=A0AAV5ADK3_9AGAM|nr:hypothetical protein Clacol_006948 [Clathrus columnatus]